MFPARITVNGACEEVCDRDSVDTIIAKNKTISAVRSCINPPLNNSAVEFIRVLVRVVPILRYPAGLIECVAILGQINRAQIAFARLAGFHTDVRKLFGDEHGKLLFILFTAKRTKDSAEFPLLRTKCALQEPLTAVTYLA